MRLPAASETVPFAAMPRTWWPGASRTYATVGDAVAAWAPVAVTARPPSAASRAGTSAGEDGWVTAEEVEPERTLTRPLGWLVGGIGAIAVVNMLKTRTAERLVALGVPPVVLASPHFVGSSEGEDQLERVYEEYFLPHRWPVY